jgi:hypothetical protein
MVNNASEKVRPSVGPLATDFRGGRGLFCVHESRLTTRATSMMAIGPEPPRDTEHSVIALAGASGLTQRSHPPLKMRGL